MGEIIVRLEGISKSFGKENVIKPLNLTFEKGKIYGLIGRNGSGKTVLLKLICGFLKPDSGQVIVNGKIIGKDREFPENTGILIENPGFLYGKNGFQNLKYLSSIRNKIGDKEIQETMEKVGLDWKSKKRVGKYSMGMRQRLGLAQAIMEKTEILLLDEPMNGLDNEGAGEIRELLKNLKGDDKVIILASHLKEDIQELCDVVFRMDAGNVEC